MRWSLQRLPAVRASVTGIRERTVRSTRAAEVIAELVRQQTPRHRL